MAKSETAPQNDKGLEQRLQKLSKAIQQFRVDSQRFFAGDLPIPPEELRIRIEADMRKLRSRGIRGVAGSFHLNSLEAQFSSQVDLYNRRLREREVGGRRVAKVQAEPKPDPKSGVVVGKSADNNAVEVLYKGLYLNSGQRVPSMDLEKFRAYIHRQSEVIRAKTGCSDIHYRVAVQDGKLKLKARPVKP